MSRNARQAEYNSLCGKCVRGCKQVDGTLLVDCPRFLPRPFKVKEHRFDQLDLFGGKKKKSK